MYADISRKILRNSRGHLCGGTEADKGPSSWLEIFNYVDGSELKARILSSPEQEL